MLYDNERLTRFCSVFFTTPAVTQNENATLVDPNMAGWVFMMDTSLVHEGRRPCWSFLKLGAQSSQSPMSLTHRYVHRRNLRGFLTAMADEGRPAPNPEIVQRAETLLQKLESEPIDGFIFLIVFPKQ